MNYTPYIVAMGITAVISAALSVYAWKHRSVRGATALAVLMLAISEWTLAYVLWLVTTDSSLKVMWAKAEYIGIVTIPVAWLAFTLQHTGQQKWLTPRRLALLAIIPIITALLAWTNETHGLIWAQYSLYQKGAMILSEKIYGSWFWMHTVYCYVLLFIGMVVIIRSAAFSSFRLYRRQAYIILIGLLVPTIGNLLYIFGWISADDLNITPFAFAVTGMVAAWGIFRFRLLDIVPVARATVIESMNDGLIILDVQNHIVDLNPAAQRIIGLPASKIIGNRADQVLFDHSEIDESHLEESIKHSMITVNEGDVERHYDLNISPFYDRKGTVSGQVVILNDITNRKQAEEKLQRSEARIRALYKSIPVPTYTWQRDGSDFVLIDCNDAAEAITQGAVTDFMGITASEMYREEPEVQEDLSRCFTEKVSIEREMMYRYRVTDQNKYLAVKYVYVPPDLILVHTEDITERKQAEEKLQELYEQEKSLRQKLEEEKSRKAEFLRVLVHELKTPLTPMLSSSMLLAELADEQSETKLVRLAKNIKRGTLRLNNRIDELMDLAKGELQMIVIKPATIDILKLLRQIAGDVSSTATAQGIFLNMVVPSSLPNIQADEERLRQIITNLINNALKFTPNGGTVTLKATQKESNLIVEVQDNGPGIATEEQQRLFTAYYRVEGDRENLSGMGLGLALCKTLVELHGGKIWVESQEGEGCTFGFSIPLT